MLGIEVRHDEGYAEKDNLVQVFEYVTVITDKPNNKNLFVPFSEELSNVLLSEFQLGEQLGDILYSYKFDAILSCSRFYPFGMEPSSGATKYLLGKGIADNIQLILAADLKKYLGNETILKIYSPSDSRKIQLGRYGVKEDGEYTMQDFYNKILDSLTNT